MSKKSHSIYCIIIASLFLSCTTFRANMFLIQNTTDNEKAELLFEEGLKQYNYSLVENSFYKDIPNIHQLFSDVLVLNPAHPEAGKYIDIINNFKTNHFKKSINTANELFKKENRTQEEDFKLVLSVCQAKDLKLEDESLPMLIKETKELKTAIIENNITTLKDLEIKITEKLSYQKQIKLLKNAKVVFNELMLIDPTNSRAKVLHTNITSKVSSITENEIEILESQIDLKKYIDAELTLRNLEFRHKILSEKPIPQIKSIKYKLFYNWGNELFSQGKLLVAKNITVLAINTDKSKEAITLLDEINKEILKINFEDSIGDILASIDHYLSIGKPLKAQKLVDNNINKFSLKKNKTALIKKEEKIKNQIYQFYNEGTELYYEEDYESAIEKLSVVVKYNKSFENADDYLNKARQKHNALSGK